MADFKSLISGMITDVERINMYKTGDEKLTAFELETKMNAGLSMALLALNSKCRDSIGFKCEGDGSSYGFNREKSSTTMGIVDESKPTRISIGNGEHKAKIILPGNSVTNGNSQVIVGRFYNEDPVEPNGSTGDFDENASLGTISEATVQWKKAASRLKRVPGSGVFSIQVLELESSGKFAPLTGGEKQPCDRTEFFIPFQTKLSDEDYEKFTDQKPVCRSYDEDMSSYVYEGVEMVRFTREGVYCKTSRLGKFFDVGWSSFIPPFTKLTKSDFQNLTIENLKKYPRGLYVVGAVLAAVLITLLWAFVHDARVEHALGKEKKRGTPVNFVKSILKDASKGNWAKWLRIFAFRFTNEHKYASLVFRSKASYFKTVERVIVLTVYLTSVLASGSIFYRKKINIANYFTVGVIS
eukprot:5267_1